MLFLLSALGLGVRLMTCGKRNSVMNAFYV